MIKENAFVQRRANWSLLPANLRRQQLADKQTLATEDDADESWWEKVQDLELNHRHLRKLRYACYQIRVDEMNEPRIARKEAHRHARPPAI